jgi:hypothetical protein
MRVYSMVIPGTNRSPHESDSDMRDRDLDVASLIRATLATDNSRMGVGKHRHCEERSDEAIQTRLLDCFASLAMTL